MNPYESPQTLGQPLPMAAEVVDVLPEDAILAIATGHCAKAGGLYLIGTALAWLLIMPQVLGVEQDSSLRRNELLIIAAILVGVIFFVFVAWGFLFSLVGYFQLRAKTHDPRLRRSYAWIVLEVWLKVLLLIALLFMPEIDFSWWRIWDKFRFLLYAGLILASLHSYYLHYRGMQLLAERCEASTLRAAIVFLISGILFMLGLSATWMYLETPYGETWVVAFGLLATLHIAAYAVGYKQVHHRFRARSARD